MFFVSTTYFVYYLFKFHGLIRRYIVLYILPKKPLLRPTNSKIRGLVRRQYPYVGAYKSPVSADQSVYIGGSFYLVQSAHGIPTLDNDVYRIYIMITVF